MTTYVSPQALAERFDVDIKTINSLIRERNLTVYRLGPRIRRLKLEEVESALAAHD